MPRYKLIIEYNGAPFCGWQRQSGFPSVQQTLEEAMEQFAGHPVRLFCAGRTDTGVHALHQVAHADLLRDWPEETVRDATNACLKDRSKGDYAYVCVLRAEKVPTSFHARLSATKRRYLYRILNRRAPPGVEAGRVWHVPQPIRLDTMRDAASKLLGHHDFTTFRSAHCQAPGPFKTLDRLDVTGEGEEIHVHAAARSFLHHQVRSMVGTIVQAGLGRWSADDVRAALEARDRTRCGPQAPACGLYFVGVDYGEPVSRIEAVPDGGSEARPEQR
ncbi:MAG: tRNA pseudouridine(38-40) synthase TruA [Methylobacteriaceae bacterium]|jgi:tRNA pseudouridine38-40 synthase|nr:tRNA pseudouridine(38-40) synthase TruA [Methylobacteriaceae bacterium]